MWKLWQYIALKSHNNLSFIVVVKTGNSINYAGSIIYSFNIEVEDIGA